MNSQIKSGAILSYINIFLKNIVTFLYIPFLLKYVGQAQYGLFQMTNSVILSLGILSMGLSSAYVKFYVAHRVKNEIDEMKKLNALYMIIFMIVSVIALIIGLIIAFNTKYIFDKSLNANELSLTRMLMIILAINLSITFISSVFDSNIIVNEQFKFQQMRQLMQSLLGPILSVPLIIFGFGVLSIAITQTFITIIFLMMNIHYCYRKLSMRFMFKGLSFAMVKPLLIFSFYILLNQIVDLVNNNAPSFIIGMFLGAKQVATFAIAIQIKNMFFMLSTSLSSVFITRVNELVSNKSSNRVLTDLMIKVGRIQMNILLLIFGGFVIVGQYFIKTWAGEENIDAYFLVLLMILPSIIPLSQNIGIDIQRAMNQHKFRSIVYIFFAIVNIILTILGTTYMGLKGSVLGYIVSIIFANGLIMNWYYHKKIKLDIKKYWKKTMNVWLPFLITCLCFRVINRYILDVNSMRTFFIFGFLYVFTYIILFYFFVATDYEKNQLKNIFKKKVSK